MTAASGDAVDVCRHWITVSVAAPAERDPLLPSLPTTGPALPDHQGPHR